jgi:hypothetical protein
MDHVQEHRVRHFTTLGNTVLSCAGTLGRVLLHWVIPSCPAHEHWVDILLHWVILSCPVQEHWVDILLHWVILSCPLIVQFVVKKLRLKHTS